MAKDKFDTPVLFLDIDGVLNTVNYLRGLDSLGQPHMDEFGHLFDPVCVRVLKEILDETGCDIVLTSTWRIEGLEHMRNMWKSRNLPGKIKDITPHLLGIARHEDQTLGQAKREVSIARGEEIQWWLSHHRDWLFKKYCIIDDDSDILLTQAPRFVRTDLTWGLESKHKENILQALRGESIIHDFADIALPWDERWDKTQSLQENGKENKTEKDKSSVEPAATTAPDEQG